MNLYPHQLDLVARCSAAFAGGRIGVMHLPTGGGKTHTAAEICRRAVARGSRVVFAAHLDTLVTDTHARLAAAGVWAGYVQAGRKAEPLAPVQVCSLATLHSRGEAPPAHLVIVDECHRALSESILGILDRYPDARILGLTATPQRGDGQPLGTLFGWMESGPTVRELTRAGFLVPADLLCLGEPTASLAMDPGEAYARHTPGSRALFFCESVEHAHAVHASLTVPAVVITGDTPREDRERYRAELAAGTLRAMVSVNVFLEGFDAPTIETVVLARGFTCVSTFIQACGRGLRTSPATGKTKCTILDLKGSALMFGLPDEDRAWSLTGKPRRTEKLASLRRCLACFALFRPASECPRCGEPCAPASRPLPRILTREEKLESLSHLPQAKRDERYLWSLVNVAKNRIKMPDERAEVWALAQFQKRFGRNPEFT